MTDIATLQSRLTEAETAYHTLMMGQATAQMQLNGRMVTYSQTNKANLKSYIAELKAEIATLSGSGGGNAPISLGHFS